MEMHVISRLADDSNSILLWWHTSTGKIYVAMEMVTGAVKAWVPGRVQVQLILSEDGFQSS